MISVYLECTPEQKDSLIADLWERSTLGIIELPTGVRAWFDTADSLCDLIERYDALAVLVATLLPPPFPFKLFVVTAGVFRFSLLRFMLAIIAGRAFRFALEGYFAVRYGAQAKEILAKYYPWIGLGLVALIVLSVFLRRLIWKDVEEVEHTLEAGN